MNDQTLLAMAQKTNNQILIEMAQNLNMQRIGVSYGVHSVETLQQYQPLTIVSSIQDLHGYFQAILPAPILIES